MNSLIKCISSIIKTMGCDNAFSSIKPVIKFISLYLSAFIRCISSLISISDFKASIMLVSFFS